MKYKITEATEQEKKDLLVFLMKDYIEITKDYFDIEEDEIDTYLSFKQQIVSIKKIEIELAGIIKIIFNTIFLTQQESIVLYHSEFLELVDDKFIDITECDYLQF
jgi:hypothetical protein